jgi:diguanylate cyclase (GGDEF)-like protein/PAS domain S-box-containing protein
MRVGAVAVVPALIIRALTGCHRRAVPVSTALTVSAAAWFAVTLAYPVGPRAAGWLPGLLVAMLAASACWSAARQAASRPAVARFWRQIGLSVALIAGAILLRAVHSFDPAADVRRMGVPVLALFLAVILVSGWALFRLPLGLSGGRQRWRFWLDAGTVMVAAALFFWYFTIRTTLIWYLGDNHIVVAGLAAASALTMVLLFAVVKVMLTTVATVDAGALRRLGVAITVGVFGSFPESLLPAHGPSTGQIVLPLTCLLAIVAAGRQSRATMPAAPEAGGGRRRSFSLLPYSAVAASSGLLLYSATTTRHTDRIIVAGAVVCLVALVLIRQVLAFMDNSRLVRQLDAGMAEVGASERRFRSLVQNSSDLITVTGPDGRLTYVSPGARWVLGIEPADWVGRHAADLVHPEDLAGVVEQYGRIKDHPGATTGYQARLAHADGSWRWVDYSTTNLVHDPAIGGIVGNARDITAERAFRQRLYQQAHYDPLTRLANRTLFHQRVEEALAARNGRLCVLLVDLNDFKAVNDTLGHPAGDALLAVLAQRLSAGVRHSDTVARLGGDEFAVLFAGIADEDVAARARGVMQAFTEPIDVAGYRTRASASIGVAAGEPGVTAEELLRRADVAMYAAKADQAGADSRYAIYTPALDTPLMHRASVEAELRTATSEGQLRLLYQPIVAAGIHHVVAVEALVRWAHPERGLLSPAQFVPLAERSDLIILVGRWVLTEACRQAGRWYAEHGDCAPAVSVNVSARQLHDPTFHDHLQATLVANGLPPRLLTVEITESTAVHPQSVEVLRGVHRLGVRVSLDDFGTGHSSLTLLQSCPVDELKLDRSFTRHAITAGQRSVAVAVVELARALGLDLVAEGVETAQQAAHLSRLGYPHLQGFHFARPTPPDSIDQMIRLRATGADPDAAPWGTNALAA